MKTIRAVYSQGVFRPTDRVDLPEPCLVEFEPRQVSEGDGKEAAAGTGSKPRRIEEVLAELASEVPQQEWDSLPSDLTDNLDHYLYGTPKR